MDLEPSVARTIVAVAIFSALTCSALRADDASALAAIAPSATPKANANATLNSAATAPGNPEKTPDEKLLELFREEANITNSLDSVLVWIPAGYRVGRTEVTQAEYEQVMGSNPSRFKGPSRPVEMVSPVNAAEFCRQLTAREQKEGVLPKSFSYALPSQQDFNTYSANTPLETAYVSFIGDHLSTVPVGSLAPNDLGLFDVRGNVWEWCEDAVARGASYQSHEDYLVPSFQFVGNPDMTVMDIGFRVVLRETGP